MREVTKVSRKVSGSLQERLAAGSPASTSLVPELNPVTHHRILQHSKVSVLCFQLSGRLTGITAAADVFTRDWRVYVCTGFISPEEFPHKHLSGFSSDI